MKRFLITSMLVLMAACGGTSVAINENVTPQDVAAARSAHAALYQEINGFSNTRNSAIPTSGSASFSGSVEIYAEERRGKEFYIVGDAGVVVQFAPIGEGRLNGQFDNFIVRENDELGNLHTYAIDGEIRVGDDFSVVGDRDGVDSNANFYSADYYGVLETREDTIVIDGEISGGFEGNLIVPTTSGSTIRGFEGNDYSFPGSGTVTINGREGYSELSYAVIADR